MTRKFKKIILGILIVSLFLIILSSFASAITCKTESLGNHWYTSSPKPASFGDGTYSLLDSYTIKTEGNGEMKDYIDFEFEVTVLTCMQNGLSQFRICLDGISDCKYTDWVSVGTKKNFRFMGPYSQGEHTVYVYVQRGVYSCVNHLTYGYTNYGSYPTCRYECNNYEDDDGDGLYDYSGLPFSGFEIPDPDCEDKYDDTEANLASCVDADSGNYLTSGSVTSKDGEGNSLPTVGDSCTGGSDMWEASCSGTTRTSTQVNCNNININTGAVLTNSGGVCQTGGVYYNYCRCPVGEVVNSAGKCVATGCSDSDGGVIYNSPGYVSGVSTTGTNYNINDYCITSDLINEYSCSGSGYTSTGARSCTDINEAGVYNTAFNTGAVCKKELNTDRGYCACPDGQNWQSDGNCGYDLPSCSSNPAAGNQFRIDDGNSVFVVDKLGQLFVEKTIQEGSRVPISGFKMGSYGGIYDGKFYVNSITVVDRLGDSVTSVPLGQFNVVSAGTRLFSIDSAGNAYIKKCYTENWIV